MIANKSYYKLILTICVLILVNACIDEYNPEITESTQLLVIQGSIIKGEETQVVTISRSRDIELGEEPPVSGCEVTIVDEHGNSFPFSETNDGIYTAKIEDQHLVVNTAYVLHVVGPDKQEYQSDEEVILESARVDSIYYYDEEFQSSSEYYPSGMQVYIDLKGQGLSTQNYRWELIESFEYHSKYPIYACFNEETGEFIQDFTIDFYTCWRSSPVIGFYSATTSNLSSNERKKIPLNYVPEGSFKLNFGYSLLVKQYSLNNGAFEYWNKNRVESFESGGLYESQPSQAQSNIYNINNPDEIVLGYFWASSVTEGRMLPVKPFSSVSSGASCPETPVDENDIGDGVTNAYYHDLNDGQGTPAWATSDESCYDCRLLGGTNIMPDYWE